MIDVCHNCGRPIERHAFREHEAHCHGVNRGDDPRPLVWSSDYEYEARNGERWYFERDLGHGFVRTINADGVRATYHKSGRVSPHMETHEDIVAVRLIAELLQ